MLLSQIRILSPVFAQVSYAIKDAFLVMGILVVLVAAIFMLTLFIKDRRPKEKSRRHRKSSRQSHKGRDSQVVEEVEEGDEEAEEVSLRVKETTVSEDGMRRRRKFRKRKKDHRPTNPTLAETGGLPAKRPEDTDGPAT